MVAEWTTHSSWFEAAENKPAAHGVQRELEVSEPPTKPWPTGQLAFVWAAQAFVLLAAEYVPGRQVEHAASAVTVAGVNACPAGHEDTDTALHAVASLVPIFHVEPSVQAWQLPLVDIVAGVKKCPGPHAATVTTEHEAAETPAFHVLPSTHAVHCPFDVAVAPVWPCPALHVLTVTAVHALVPAVVLNVVPAVHAEHRASALVVAAWNPWPAAHDVTVTGVHAALLEAGL